MWRVHPEAEQEFIFLENCKILAVGEVIYVVLACVLRATTKKGRQLFREEKCTPRQNPGYAYESLKLIREYHRPTAGGEFPSNNTGIDADWAIYVVVMTTRQYDVIRQIYHCR